MRRTLPALALLAFGAVLCACSDDNSGGSTTLSVAKATNSGDGQTAVVGEALANPLRVIVTNNGAAANGVTVTWATPNGGSVAPATSTTDANGIATTTWTLGSGAGSQTASASVSSASGSPVTFTATATAAPTTLSVAKTTTNSGDAQTGPGGQALPNPLRVIVNDGGVPANGVTVSWATPSGGSVAPATSTTDANGIATTTWTLGGGGGAQTASASVNSASGSPVIFTATSTAAPNITVSPGGQLQFSPATISINAGQSVQFIWATGAVNHNVSPASGNATAIPSSPGLPGVQNAPFEFTTVFPSAGTFRFFCSIHGSNPSPNTVAGMSGTITVN